MPQLEMRRHGGEHLLCRSACMCLGNCRCVRRLQKHAARIRNGVLVASILFLSQEQGLGLLGWVELSNVMKSLNSHAAYFEPKPVK